MDKQDDGRFVFGADEKHEPIAHDDQTRMRLDNLGLRVTLIAIIMPCLMGIVMVFGYIDMNRRVSVFKSSGSEEVRNASKDMERMISSLQVKNARVEKLLAVDLADIKTRLKSLDTKVARTRKDVDFITSTRITKRQVNDRIATLKRDQAKNDKALALLQTDASEAIDRTRKLEKSGVTASKSLTRIKGELSAVQKKMSALAGSLPTMEEIDVRLRKERIMMQVRIDEMRASLEKRINQVATERAVETSPEPSTPPAPQAGAITEQAIGN